MRYFYRIKVPKINTSGEFENEWEYKVFSQGYIEANSRAEAKKQLETKYDINICSRSRRDKIGVSNFFLLTLFEQTDYFDNVWLSESECEYCKKSFTKLERDTLNDFTYIRSQYCSKDCEIKGEEGRLEKKLEDYKNNNVDGIHNPVIYKITNNKTNKCYIGQTTLAFTFRWYQHFFQAKGKDTKFANEISKSSVTDWTFRVLEIVTKENKNSREQYWIEKFDSINNGYNSIKAIKCEK